MLECRIKAERYIGKLCVFVWWWLQPLLVLLAFATRVQFFIMRDVPCHGTWLPCKILSRAQHSKDTDAGECLGARFRAFVFSNSSSARPDWQFTVVLRAVLAFYRSTETRWLVKGRYMALHNGRKLEHIYWACTLSSCLVSIAPPHLCSYPDQCTTLDLRLALPRCKFTVCSWSASVHHVTTDNVKFRTNRKHTYFKSALPSRYLRYLKACSLHFSPRQKSVLCFICISVGRPCTPPHAAVWHSSCGLVFWPLPSQQDAVNCQLT